MSRYLYEKICIVGVGLIGGSIGLAVKKKKIAKLAIGVSRQQDNLKIGLRKKVIDVGVLNPAEGVEAADLVILCMPVSVIAWQMKMIASCLKKGAVVIDVGSSKSLIEKEASRYFKSNVFVGCHPMAVSERCGIDYASADLFQDAVCFMTKPNLRIAQFWKSLGASPVVMDAARHDQWVAKASRLPHLLAFALFQNFKSPAFPLNPSLQALARLAKSNPELWADILLSNRQAVLRAAGIFEKNFSQLKKALIKDDFYFLKRQLEKSCA